MSFPDLEFEKRRFRRSLCSELVEVSFKDQRGRDVRQTALLEDVSPGGACLGLDLPITPGRRIRLEAEGFEREARVRYCELIEGGYVIGLEFAPGAEWDRRLWRPKHLLNAPEE